MVSHFSRSPLALDRIDSRIESAFRFYTQRCLTIIPLTRERRDSVWSESKDYPLFDERRLAGQPEAIAPRGKERESKQNSGKIEFKRVKSVAGGCAHIHAAPKSIASKR